jgi:hypothetical protein
MLRHDGSQSFGPGVSVGVRREEAERALTVHRTFRTEGGVLTDRTRLPPSIAEDPLVKDRRDLQRQIEEWMREVTRRVPAGPQVRSRRCGSPKTAPASAPRCLLEKLALRVPVQVGPTAEVPQTGRGYSMPPETAGLPRKRFQATSVRSMLAVFRRFRDSEPAGSRRGGPELSACPGARVAQKSFVACASRERLRRSCGLLASVVVPRGRSTALDETR